MQVDSPEPSPAMVHRRCSFRPHTAPDYDSDIRPVKRKQDVRQGRFSWARACSFSDVFENVPASISHELGRDEHRTEEEIWLLDEVAHTHVAERLGKWLERAPPSSPKPLPTIYVIHKRSEVPPELNTDFS